MNRAGQAVLAAAGLAAFLALWEASSWLGWVSAGALPPPSIIPSTFLTELRQGIWLTALGQSFGHYLVGLGLGGLLGVATGVATGVLPWLDAGLAWVVRLLRPIPGLAWVPFAILWFGISPTAAIFIIAVAVFWICFFAAHAAVRAVDPDLIEVAAAFGYRTRLSQLTKVVLPAAAPGILGGLRASVGQAWMAVVAAEIFGVAGLGQRMMQASNLLASEIVVVYMLTMAAAYGLVDTLFVTVQSRLLRWMR